MGRSSIKTIISTSFSVIKDLDTDLRNAQAREGAQAGRILRGFSAKRRLPLKKKFVELCFCILVANSNLGQTKRAWERVGSGFLALGEPALRAALKRNGVRFHNRAAYIIEARGKMADIGRALRLHPDVRIREWLHDNIRGLGWKESSHFLRNLGFTDFAILDTHVAGVMRDYGLIRKAPKSLSSEKTYLSLERILEKKAETLGMSMAELDCYLFYLGSGKLPRK
jgi:N-glycosylase/DNA lyase